MQGLSEAFHSWQEERKKQAAAEAAQLAVGTAAATQDAWATAAPAGEAAKDSPFSDQDVSELEWQSMAAKRTSEDAAERLDQAKKARAAQNSHD